MQQFFDFPVTPICTFDTFISCDGNAGALQFARRLADRDDPENLLFIHGPHGSGKSHLLKAIATAARPVGGRSAPVFTCGDSSCGVDLSTFFADAPALLVDDLHLMPDDAGMRAALWQLFNDFHAAGLPIALTGLVPPRELPYLDDHLISRLLWGLVARVDVSDDHSRQMILRKVAADRQVRIPDDVVDFILMTVSREVSDLIAAFQNIYAESMSSKRRITLQLAREVRERLRAGAVS